MAESRNKSLPSTPDQTANSASIPTDSVHPYQPILHRAQSSPQFQSQPHISSSSIDPDPYHQVLRNVQYQYQNNGSVPMGTQQLYNTSNQLYFSNPYATPPSFGNFAANITQFPGAPYFAPAVVYPYPLHGVGAISQYNSYPVGGMHGINNIPFSSHISSPQRSHITAGYENSLVNRKEWFDYLLHLAHQKYNTNDYASALSILQDLYNLNQTHLPTLLLLGCTCYSLRLHHMSIFYNNLILSIDQQFAEAYSNLGTTYRAMAQDQGTQNNTYCSSNRQIANLNLPPALMHKSDIDCSEYYYRRAITIRPKYWDASINLSGLLSSQGRFLEAFEVYDGIEKLMEQDLPCGDSLYDIKSSTQTFSSDFDVVKRIMEAERNRRNAIAYLRYQQSPSSPSSSCNSPSTDPNDFTVERRRDLYFAKGNLKFAMGKVDDAKLEYFKGLAAVGLDVIPIFQSVVSGAMPSAALSPQTAFSIYQQRQNTSTANKSDQPLSHPTTSSILQTLAKIYQDHQEPAIAVSFYYMSLSIYPTANTCNNLGILLASHRLAESVQWYEFGLVLDPNHVHLYTNLGSALKDRNQINEGIYCYQRAIAIQPEFFIALANLANVYKDLGRVEEAIELYARGLKIKPDFIEAFCNYVNSLLFICNWVNRDSNLEKIKDIVGKQLKEGKKSTPNAVPTVLPFHTFTYSSLTSWMVREISKRNGDRVIWNVTSSDWFPEFPLRPKQLLEKFHGDVASIPKELVERSLNYPFPYSPPSKIKTHIRVGYISSDFNNHPLAHLMQSVFGIHDRNKFKVYCYSLTPTDNSPYRKKIESECDVFIDVSGWSVKDIVERISNVDKIYVLCNLNGYTKGGRNEIFAARPCPLQLSFMGYAGTMGAGNIYDPENNQDASTEQTTPNHSIGDLEFFDTMNLRWIDYMVVDEVACPRKLVCGEPLSADEVHQENMDQLTTYSAEGRTGDISEFDDRNRVYTEGLIFMPESYFCNDHRQGFREQEDLEIDRLVSSNYVQGMIVGRSRDDDYLSDSEHRSWRKEEIRRLKMRNEIFPNLKEDTIIFANFNQLYKIDPNIFKTWMNILSRVPNSILWLLRFPPAGEKNLRKLAVEYVGEQVAQRLVFTAVASKHIHIHRGRVADIFLDTPECNAHTTAADILWSGTPMVTYPKYEFKMCSRVAASVAYATGSWDERDTKNYYAKEVPKGLNLKIPRLKNKTLMGHHMVVNSYTEYEERAVSLGTSLKWNWKSIGNIKIESLSSFEILKSAHNSPFFPNRTNATHIYSPNGLALDLRRNLFLKRDSMPLFDTHRWVRNLERGMALAVERFERGWVRMVKRNEQEMFDLRGGEGVKEEEREGVSRCFWVET